MVSGWAGAAFAAGGGATAGLAFISFVPGAAGGVAAFAAAGAAAGVDAPETLIWPLSLPNSPSLMPGTFMMSSGVLNGPFLAR